MCTRKPVLLLRTVALFAVMALVGLTGCSMGGSSQPPPSNAEVEGQLTTPPEETPSFQPVPEGCPSAEDFGSAYVSQPDWADALDMEFVRSQLLPELPGGGCAYSRREVLTSESGKDYRFVQVWYFRMDEADQLSRRTLLDWALEAAGTEAEPGRFDLPTTFSGWTGSTLGIVDGETSSWFLDDRVLPAYTQGAHARIEFAMNADRVEKIIELAVQGDEVDPTTAMADGLSAGFSASFDVEDKKGYTASIRISGRMDPFVSVVTDSAPGEFEAVGTAAVQGIVTNTTESRNAKPAGVRAIALYPLDSAVCSSYNGISVEGDGWKSPSYCQLSVEGIASDQLAPDASEVIPATRVEIPLGPFREDGEALAELNAPLSVYASFGGQPGLTNPSWTSDVGCQAQTQSSGGLWVLPMDGWPDILCD